MADTFKYYLHDGYNSIEREDYVSNQLGRELTESERAGLRYAFYEVCLSCELVDGNVKIVSAEAT